MAIQRASFIGHESLANNFDLKKLRDLSFLLMQVQKQQLCEIPQVKESVHGCVERLNVARQEISEEFREMSAEELMAFIGSDRKKKISELFGDDFLTGKKKKTKRFGSVLFAIFDFGLEILFSLEVDELKKGVGGVLRIHFLRSHTKCSSEVFIVKHSEA
ncbi:unnamed protein product [Lactuca virosa]|uniref:Uncharacterized protein n=1 Tax=Lactuca virosa TaxID=75947 RepID=A0AAU9LPE2_9ASTR|nr:unnamed protein product [Lactuca virosa]